MLGLLFLLALGLLIAIIAMTGYTIHILTHPPRRTYATALARNKPGEPTELPGAPRPFTTWTFRAGDIDLPVWDIPADHPSGPIVIMSHGWGDSRIGALSRIAAFVPLASRIIAYDLRGHGEAPGTCTLGTREVSDLIALIEQLETTQPIILYGWSLGGVVSIAAAAKTKVSAAIAEAPYRIPITPARNVMISQGLPHTINLPLAMWLVGLDFGAGATWSKPEPFDRAFHAAKLACPLLVLHGDADEISPLEDGRQIASSAKRARIHIVPNGGHHGLWTNPDSSEECRKAISDFVKEHLPP